MTGLEKFAVDCKTGVSFKKTSERKALLYAVVPFVNPSLLAVALPSCSPSPNTSVNDANCLLCNVSGTLVGCGGDGGDGLPPAPLITFLSVLLLLVLCQRPR